MSGFLANQNMFSSQDYRHLNFYIWKILSVNLYSVDDVVLGCISAIIFLPYHVFVCLGCKLEYALYLNSALLVAYGLFVASSFTCFELVTFIYGTWVLVNKGREIQGYSSIGKVFQNVMSWKQNFLWACVPIYKRS